MIKNTIFLALSLLTVWSVSAQTYYGEQHILFQFDEYSGNTISTCDFDGDGDIDFLVAPKSNDTLAWYENTDGNGTFGEPHIISDTANGSVRTCDIDDDGDQDVLASSSDVLAWYENTDGGGTFGEPQIIPGFAGKVYVCDIDGDGDQDVFKAGTYELAWNENTDGEGTFGEPQTIPGSAAKIYFCDIDGDGDQDVLKDGGSKLAWNENTDGNGTFGEEQLIAMPDSKSVLPCDMDGDGDQDILIAYSDYSNNGAGDYIYWIENSDGNGTFDVQHNVINRLSNVQFMVVCDIDGDGDPDVLTTSTGAHYSNGLWGGSYSLGWHENTDGNGTFGAHHAILGGWTESSDPICVISASTYDIDGDGDLDVLSATSFNDKIAWYINTDGHGTFGGEQVPVGSANFPRSARTCDIDGDGDQDVLSVSSLSKTIIAWYENIEAIIVTQPTNDTICPRSDAVFSLTAECVETYQWQVDAGAGFTDLNDNAVYSGVTTHTLLITNADTHMNGYIYRCVLNLAGTIYSDEAVLTVADNTAPNISCIGNQTAAADETHHYKVCGTEFDPTETSDNCGVASVENDFNNTATLSGAQIPEGITTITWTITDNTGNENSCSFDVNVSEYNLEVEKRQQKGISIYPNPTTGMIYLESENTPVQRLNIFDISGTKMFEITHIRQNESIDLSCLDSGIYMIRIQTTEEILILKMVKE